MENKIAEKIIESAVDDIARVDPQAATRLGMSGHNDVWNPPRGEELARRVEILDHYSQLMKRSVDVTKLTHANKVHAGLLEYGARRAEAALEYREYMTLINPVDGPQVTLPTLLITAQPARTLQDFKDYISRLRAFAPHVDRLIAIDRKRRKQGLDLPAAGMDMVKAECQALTSGRPFTKTDDPSTLLADFDTRLRLAKLAPDLRDTLKGEAIDALQASIGPGCARLSAYAASIAGQGAKGIWTLPKGEAWYAERLAWFTSSDLSPDQIHELSIQQMSRVTSQIEDVMNKEGFEGSPAQFMEHLRAGKNYRIDPGSDNIQKWLNKVGSYIFAMDADLDDIVGRSPDTDMDVRAMAPFQQATGKIASYDQSAQLGIFFIDLTAIPDYEVEATTFRYAIPGRHVIPMSPLNRILPMPAFTRGWSLYSLELPSQFGYYKEPKTRLGSLLVAATAIAESVVDTGLNYKRWDRDRAVRYLLDHSTLSRRQASEAVERILARPGSATAAVVGAATIERLRDKCAQTLGKAFSIKAFNQAVLRYGPVPMSRLEQDVNQWLAAQQAGKMSHNKP